MNFPTIQNINLFNFSIVFVEEQQEDDTPKPDWKPAPEVPREENRSGSNKKTYFVCNDRKFSFKKQIY